MPTDLIFCYTKSKKKKLTHFLKLNFSHLFFNHEKEKHLVYTENFVF